MLRPQKGTLETISGGHQIQFNAKMPCDCHRK